MRRAARGFTLPEILLAIAMLSGVVVLYGAMANISFLSTDVGHKDIALNIAAHKIEELKATSYASLPASGTFTEPGLSELPGASASFTVSDYNADTKTITVSVSWQPQGKTARTITLTTLKTRIGGL